jgi:putative RecB family exonuclease
MPIYSHSRLKTFDQCPLKFKLEYLDCVETDVESVESFLGSRVHEALEMLHRDLSEGKLIRLDDLINFYSFRWESNWHSGVRIVRSDRTVEEYWEYGVDCINNYYDANFPFDQCRTVSLEERVEFNLDWSRERHFQGFLDRIALRDDGTYEIHDYKTTRRIPNQSQLMNDRQLSLYQVGLQSMRPEARPVELVWHFLSRGMTFRLQRSESDLLQILQETNRLVDRIESETRFPANVGPLCDWCEFRDICPAWK